MNYTAVGILCKESGFYAGNVVLIIPMPSLEQNPLVLAMIAKLVALAGGKTKSLLRQLEYTHLKL